LRELRASLIFDRISQWCPKPGVHEACVMNKFKENSLYLVTGEDCSGGRTTIDIVKAAIQGGVDVVQMREKTMPRERLSALGKDLAGMCRDAGVLFIVNDDPYLAKEVGADGVHLGQEDVGIFPVEKARSILGPEGVIGVSTHSLEQFLEVNGKDVDYIAFGPVFFTKTKDYYIGTRDIPAVLRAAIKPVVFIGGIDRHNVGEVLALGARNVAMIRAITLARDVKEAVTEMRAKMKSDEQKEKSVIVRINGKEHSFDERISLLGLIESKGLKKDRIVIEHNRKMLPRETWRDVSICEGDSLEIVSFVGGG
jgi:thiamine-phosphate pyrophosphorylase